MTERSKTIITHREQGWLRALPNELFRITLTSCELNQVG